MISNRFENGDWRMQYNLVQFKFLPVVFEEQLSEEKIEQTILKGTFGCCFVLNSCKQLIGMIKANDLKKGSSFIDLVKPAPIFKSIEDVLKFRGGVSKESDKYALYPILDECNVLQCAYYFSDYKLELELETIDSLFFLKNNGYNYYHYLKKSRAEDAKMTIYSDIQNIRSSILFANELNKLHGVKKLSVYLPKRANGMVEVNMMDNNIDIHYVDSLYDLLTSDFEIIFVNDEKYKTSEHLKIVKANRIRSRYLIAAITTIKGKYFNDYSSIAYRHLWEERGVKMLGFAIPTAEDIGVKTKKASPAACINFIKRDMAKGNDAIAQEMNKARHEFVINEVKTEQTRYYLDIASKYFNVTSKCRKVVNCPQEYKNSIYLVGPCIVAGLYTEDKYTLGSALQSKINKDNTSFRVVALPIPNDSSRKYFFSTLEKNFEPEKGDIIVWVDQTIRMMKWDVDCINEYKMLIEEFGEEVYYDRPIHGGIKATDMVAETLYQSIEKIDRLNTKKYEEEYATYYNEEEYKVDDKKTFEGNVELEKYKSFLKENNISKKIVNGSIVMNCNPFTLGHQYLIESAAKEVDYLYIFVVEEDKSYFKFADRLELVKKGVAHLSNVKVIPSGKFIISSNTFSEYFDKANLKGTTIDTSLDVETFAQQIAPCLDISIRFVGEEPLDPITNQYNQSMKRLLPKHGIELKEIPRKEQGDGVISASRVRKCLDEKNWNEIKQLVPKSTYDFLWENFQ